MSNSTPPPQAADDASRVADLQSVLDVSRELNATTELMRLLQKVETAALKVLRCERATIFVYDPERHELYSELATGVDAIRFGADQGIAGEAVKSGERIHVRDAYRDRRFNPDIDRQTGFTTRNMITLPLTGIDGKVVGVLQVLNKVDGAFSRWDEELVSTFGAQVGVVLQRQLLLDEYAEKQKIERDLSIARDIQQALLGGDAPQLEGIDIAGWNRPADETGGDCYDYFRVKGERLAISITDATGHGIGPALVMAETRALFRAMAHTSDDLPTITQQVNALLSDDLPDDRFVTAFFGLLDIPRRSLNFLSAGHGPILEYRHTSGVIHQLTPDAVPLGFLPELTLPAPHTFAMEIGDMMVLVTDGFFEWPNRQGELFGIGRVCDVIVEHAERSAAEIISALCQRVETFAAGAPQNDDLTAVIVKRTG